MKRKFESGDEPDTKKTKFENIERMEELKQDVFFHMKMNIPFHFRIDSKELILLAKYLNHEFNSNKNNFESNVSPIDYNNVGIILLSSFFN
jgi:hypothetical protein